MPDGGRRLREVSTDRAIRAFQRFGYSVRAATGKHYVLVCAGRRNVVLPKAKRVKPGLLIYQVKQAGLSIDEFEDQLK